jgi:hypothetical protein
MTDSYPLPPSLATNNAAACILAAIGVAQMGIPISTLPLIYFGSSSSAQLIWYGQHPKTYRKLTSQWGPYE